MKRVASLWLAFALLLAGSVMQPVSALSLYTNDFVDSFSVTDAIFGDSFLVDLFDVFLSSLKEQFSDVYTDVCLIGTKISAIYDGITNPFRSFFQFVTVSGESMEPTIHDGDIVLMSGLFYKPDNGDIIVFQPRGEDVRSYIKRVIATERQTVDIKNGMVYVDGICLQEEYISAQIAEEYPGEYPRTVPQDCVFVLGDNRNNSCDSRDSVTVGMVAEDSIAGKAYYRIFPFDDLGSLYWNYNLK